MSHPILNKVKERFLSVPEAAAQCLEPEGKIQDFEIIKQLGSGAFGKVYLVEHKITKARYALKAIDKRNKTNKDEKEYFKRETEIMYKINHPNVVRLFSHFEDDNYCYLIMEYINKGNIFNLIPKDKSKRLSPQIVASIMKDVISAVYYLHCMNPPIIHRDIKPENVLLNEEKVAKLTDFGWSNYRQQDEKRTTVCGTPIYLAPEIVNETGHDEKVDLWCLGVLLFELSTGSMPFLGRDLDSLKENIRHMKIAWPRDINVNAKNLIMKILKYEPNARMPLVEMLNHPFFTKYFPEPAKFLMKPDENVKLAPFVISKQKPGDPVMYIKQEEKKEENTNKGGNGSNGENNNELREKYNFLKKEYDSLKEEMANNKEVKKLEMELQVVKTMKEDLSKQVDVLKKKVGELEKDKEKDKETEGGESESELQGRLKELEKENAELKEKLGVYEKKLTSNENLKVENAIKELKESLTGDNIEKIKGEINKLKAHVDEEVKGAFIMVINQKDKEIEQLKEELNSTQKKEKNRYIGLVNKYDVVIKQLTKENKDLKDKLSKLEQK